MSPELKEFFQSWLNWVAIGAPDMQPFSRKEGLCFSISRLARPIHDELIQLIKKEFGHDTFYPDGQGPVWIYPFGGCDLYSEQHRNKTMHKNQERINWVRKMLEENDK